MKILENAIIELIIKEYYHLVFQIEIRYQHCYCRFYCRFIYFLLFYSRLDFQATAHMLCCYQVKYNFTTQLLHLQCLFSITHTMKVYRLIIIFIKRSKLTSTQDLNRFKYDSVYLQPIINSIMHCQNQGARSNKIANP